MADRIRVGCINKTDRDAFWERISHIGGMNPDGAKWRLTLDQAINGIETGKWSFFVMVNGVSTDVIIAKTENGHKYLKTVADGNVPNNLLSLPECPRI